MLSKKAIDVLMTNDVETTSLVNHCLMDKTGAFVRGQGMPRLLELYAKYNVKATFFYTGHIAKLYPETVKMAYEAGHEVGSHGLTHEVSQAFDVLSFEEQLHHLSTSKAILEDITGERIISFRAPAARVGNSIGKALYETGFLIDSSVAPQRLDMFLSFGALKKLNWLHSPRKPYFMDHSNPFRKSDTSEVMEIPISAFGLPYIGTFMRIAPVLFQMTRNALWLESKFNQRPFVFLTHPNEFIDEEREMSTIQRRANSYISYLLGDVIRHRLKLRNLGIAGIPLLEKELQFFEKHKVNFTSCKEIYYSIKEKQ